jgi:hypothetical protein
METYPLQRPLPRLRLHYRGPDYALTKPGVDAPVIGAVPNTRKITLSLDHSLGMRSIGSLTLSDIRSTVVGARGIKQLAYSMKFPSIFIGISIRRTKR